MHIIECRQPDIRERPGIVATLYDDIRASEPWGRRFGKTLAEQAIDGLAESGLSVRAIKRELRQAMARATHRTGKKMGIRVETCDIVIPENEYEGDTLRIGFL